MNITQVKVYPTQTDGNYKATASITIDDCFVVTGIKVISGSKGLFVAMPNRKTPGGEFKDICYPVTKDTREAINQMVLDAYLKPQDKPHEQEEICPDCHKPMSECDCLPF